MLAFCPHAVARPSPADTPLDYRRAQMPRIHPPFAKSEGLARDARGPLCRENTRAYGQGAFAAAATGTSGVPRSADSKKQRY